MRGGHARTARRLWVFGSGLQLRSPFRMRLILFNGNDAGIEAGSSMLEFRQKRSRVSGFDNRGSIRASTTTNVVSLRMFWTYNVTE
jgi:hypothetical protein